MWRSTVLALSVTLSPLLAGVSPCRAEGTDEAPIRSYIFGAPAGIHSYRPGAWGMVAVEVRNTGDRPARVLATMYFAGEPDLQRATAPDARFVGEPTLQYGRQMWLPARARRYSWCPVLVPRSIPRGTTTVEVKSRLYDRSGPREVPLTSPSELRDHSRFLRIDHSPMVTGLISDRGFDDEDSDNRAASDLVVAGKISLGVSPAWSDLFEDFLPPVAESLDGLDHLVLSSDRLASDAAGLTAVRRWLHAGGRLWVMLDRVDPTTVELLLGNSFRCHVVDRVGLTHVRIEDASPAEEVYDDQPREFDQPVDLVRVLATDVEVRHTVNGWPASFWQTVGRGRVLLTTLGPHAWIRPRTARDLRPKSPLNVPPFAATEPFERLSREFFQSRQPPILKSRQLESYLVEQIGYRIVGRGSVAAVLGGFCLALLVAGVWLARRKQSESMIWIGPGAAGLATLTLVAMGWLNRQAVPPTLAVAQVVEVDSGVDDVHLTGLAAIYNQRPSDAAVGAQREGIFQPDMTGLGDTTRRMVRTDLDTWHWDNRTLPAGVRTAEFQYAARIDHPMEARAAVGPAGLTGTLTAGPFVDLSDAVLATAWRGNLSVQLDDGQGGFAARAEDVLAPGQFIAGSFLSDQQRRRQSIYQQLLGEHSRSTYPDRPVLLAWAKPLDMQRTLPDQMRRAGSALLAIPLEIERAPPGARVRIPPPLLDYRSVRSPQQEFSGQYSNHGHEWIEARGPSKTCLRFQIPPEVLPIEIDEATLTVRINAPSRTLEIVGWAQGEPLVLASRNSPVGTSRFKIDRLAALELDDQGGLLLGVNVGDHRGSSLGDSRSLMRSPLWKIESVRLEVAGRTLQRPDDWRPQ